MKTISAFLLLLLATLFLAKAAFAQVSGQAFAGFSGESKDPVQIEADELEVLDADNKAIFTGNVKVRQGSSLITTSKLVVFYLKKGGGGGNDIDKLVMTGGMIATSKENTVTADKGTYFMTTENVILEGKVVISQGENVATGCKLVANLKTNQATITSCKEGGRVSTVFRPGSAPQQ